MRSVAAHCTRDFGVRLPQAAPLVDVSCNDRLAKQVTGAQGYSPNRGAGIEKPCRYAQVIRPGVIETGGIVEVSLDPQDDALPRLVFHAYTNRPTVGEGGELRILPGYCGYRALAGRLNLALAAERRAKGGEHVRQDLANGHFTR